MIRKLSCGWEGMWRRTATIKYRGKFLKYVKAIPKNSPSNG